MSTTNTRSQREPKKICANPVGIRSRSGRDQIDQWVTDVAENHPTLWRTRIYFRIVRALRAQTDLLHRSRLNDSGSPLSIQRVLFAAASLAKHSRQFARDPEFFYRDSQRSLMRQWVRFTQHLIEPFPGPAFLSRSWLDENAGTWAQSLHLRLANGVSLTKIGMPSGTTVNRVVARYFMRASDDMTAQQAIQFAWLMSLAQQSHEAMSPEYAAHASRLAPMAEDRQQEHFWNGVLRFIERNRPPIDELPELLEVFRKVKFDLAQDHLGYHYPATRIDEGLCVGNWSLRRARRFANQWRSIYEEEYLDQVISTNPSRHPWKPTGIASFWQSTSPSRAEGYWITELLTPDELRLEGSRLSHCVATYQQKCRKGDSSIWSLRHVHDAKSKPLVTIEVHPERRVIVEMRGKRNRLPTKREAAVIHQWARLGGIGQEA